MFKAGTPGPSKGFGLFARNYMVTSNHIHLLSKTQGRVGEKVGEKGTGYFRDRISAVIVGQEKTCSWFVLVGRSQGAGQGIIYPTFH